MAYHSIQYDKKAIDLFKEQIEINTLFASFHTFGLNEHKHKVLKHTRKTVMASGYGESI